MAFKINKPIIQGTSGHRSALKSVEYDRAAQKDPNLGNYVKKRKSLKKGSDEYKANQSKINAAYGVGGKKSSSSTKRSTSKTPKSSSTINKTISNGKKGTSFSGKKTTEKLAGDGATAWMVGKGGQTKVGQKILKKSIGKGATKLATKLASRAVPGLGWALAAYDVGKLGYYSVKKGSFKEGLKDLGRDYGADDLGFYE